MEVEEVYAIDWRAARAYKATPEVTVGDTTYGPPLDSFDFANGRGFVHPADRCAMGNCVVHNPSEHGTRALPMLLREHTLVERVCPHGIGHPDPDSVAFFLLAQGSDMGVHGCDGCCGRKWFDARRLECPECGSPMLEGNQPGQVGYRYVCTNFGGCELAPG